VSRERLARHFDERARSFDGIYSGRKSAPRRLFDRLARRNVRDRLEWSLDVLAPLEGRHVLDAGCGSGRHAVELARRGAHVVGVDVSPTMLDMARAAASEAGVDESCRFVEADAAADDVPGAPFEACVAMGVLDYTHEPARLLRRLGELTDGPVLCSLPARWSLRVPARKAWLTLKGCPVRFYDERDVREVCSEAGLAIEDLTRRGPIYLLAARQG